MTQRPTDGYRTGGVSWEDRNSVRRYAVLRTAIFKASRGASKRPAAHTFSPFLGSSTVEHAAVNRRAAGSNPARGARCPAGPIPVGLFYCTAGIGMMVKSLIGQGQGGIGFLLVCVLVLSACGSDSPDASSGDSTFDRSVVPDSMTIPRMLESDGRFSTLRAALDSTGLDSLLATDGPYTLFAPPNKAFEALPPGTVAELLSEQRDRLASILRRHVVQGRIPTGELSGTRDLITLNADTLSLRRVQKKVSVGEAAIVDGGIEAANGLLHVVDRVLMPPAPGGRNSSPTAVPPGERP